MGKRRKANESSRNHSRHITSTRPSHHSCNTVNVRHRRAAGSRGPLNGGKGCQPLGGNQFATEYCCTTSVGRPPIELHPREPRMKTYVIEVRTMDNQEHLALRREIRFFWHIFSLFSTRRNSSALLEQRRKVRKKRERRQTK